MPSADLDLSRPFATPERWQSLGELDRAIDAYSELLAAGIGGADGLERRAALKRELGRLHEAAADLELGASVEPSVPWAQLRHAHMLEGLGRPLAALALRRAAMSRDRHPEVRVFAISSHLALHWLDGAWRIARELPEDLPDWWGGARERALAAYRALRSEVIARLRARRGAPDAYLHAVAVLDGLVRLGRLRVAQTLCTRLRLERPDDYTPCDLQRRILERREGPEAALAYLRAVAPRHGGNPGHIRALGLLLHDLAHYAEALEVLARTPPEHELDDVRMARAAALRLLDRRAELRAFCRDWLSASPRSVAPAGFVTSAALSAGGAVSAARASAPCVLAQFWDAVEPPEDVSRVMAGWPEHHPGLDHRVFHTETARDFLRRGFGGEAVRLFDACRHAAMKADLFRVAFLLHEGGAWIDADERCLRPMHDLLKQSTGLELLAPLSGDTPGYVHNFFLGARRGSRVMERAFKGACTDIKRLGEGVRPDIWQMTGPGLITRAAAAHLLERGDADVRLIALGQYRAFAATEVNLDYKRVPATNWHAQ